MERIHLRLDEDVLGKSLSNFPGNVGLIYFQFGDALRRYYVTPDELRVAGYETAPETLTVELVLVK